MMNIADALKWADNWGPLQCDPPSGDAPALMRLAAEVRRLGAENERLRAFANAVLGGWPDDICLDGFELQDHAVKHGLLALKDPRPTAPCGECCNCVEYHGSDPADWAQGVDCYVKTAMLGHNGVFSGGTPSAGKRG